LNCGHSLQGEDVYCPRCGQAAATHRFSFAHFLHEFFHAFTHTDKSVFALIRGLSTRPGHLVREYLDGQRKKYFNPFTFLLLVAAFSILVLQFSGTFKGNSPRQPENTAAGSPGSARVSPPPASVNPRIAAIQERARKVGAFMEKKQNLVMIIAVPFNSLIFFVFYLRRKRNYTEHLVANVFFVAFVILFSSIIFYPMLALFSRPPAMYAILMLMLLSHILYYAWAYGQLFEMKSWKERVGVFLVSLLAIALWSMLTRTIITWYIRGF
jgi:Na+/melibiose symporter-like transporter